MDRLSVVFYFCTTSSVLDTILGWQVPAPEWPEVLLHVCHLLPRPHPVFETPPLVRGLRSVDVPVRRRQVGTDL